MIHDPRVHALLEALADLGYTVETDWGRIGWSRRHPVAAGFARSWFTTGILGGVSVPASPARRSGCPAPAMSCAGPTCSISQRWTTTPTERRHHVRQAPTPNACSIGPIAKYSVNSAATTHSSGCSSRARPWATRMTAYDTSPAPMPFAIE